MDDRSSIPGRCRKGIFFFLRHRVETGSGVHPAFYTMGTGGCLSEGKVTGPWNWPLSSIEYRS